MTHWWKSLGTISGNALYGVCSPVTGEGLHRGFAFVPVLTRIHQAQSPDWI